MKRIISLLLSVLLCGTLFIGCEKKEKANDTETEAQTDAPIDYSEYAFAAGYWERDAEHDTETIYFGADGAFRYYCGCGNPVNDSDLCEGYKYDDTSKTITLDCIETTDEMVTTIKIVKCEGNELHLDFDGDIRVFTKGE